MSDKAQLTRALEDSKRLFFRKEQQCKSLEQKLEVAEGKVKELDNTIFGMHTALSAKDSEIKSLEKIKDAADAYVGGIKDTASNYSSGLFILRESLAQHNIEVSDE